MVFLISESGHDYSSGFWPKEQASDWLTYLVYQLEAVFLVRNRLNSCPDTDLRKVWLLRYRNILLILVYSFSDFYNSVAKWSELTKPLLWILINSVHKTSIFVKRSIAFETNWCKTLHTTYFFFFFFVSLSQTLEYLEYKHWQWYTSKPSKVLKSLRNFYTSFSLVKSQLISNNKWAILKPKIVPKNIFDISPSKF